MARAGATGRFYLWKSHHRPARGTGQNEGLGLGRGREDCEGAGVNIPSAHSRESALLVPSSSRGYASLRPCSGPAVTSIWILGFPGKLSSKFVPSSAATQQKKKHIWRWQNSQGFQNSAASLAAPALQAAGGAANLTAAPRHFCGTSPAL